MKWIYYKRGHRIEPDIAYALVGRKPDKDFPPGSLVIECSWTDEDEPEERSSGVLFVSPRSPDFERLGPWVDDASREPFSEECFDQPAEDSADEVRT